MGRIDLGMASEELGIRLVRDVEARIGSIDKAHRRADDDRKALFLPAVEYSKQLFLRQSAK